MITKNLKLQTPNSKPTYHLSLITYHLLSKKAEGQIMIIAIVFLAVILILASALFGRVADFVRFGSNSIIKEQATDLAEAGIDYAIWQLNKTAGAYAGPEINKAVGTAGTFSITITPKTSSLKTITATGYIPNSTTPRAKRTIKTDVLVSSETISFHYAVQVGQEGVSMYNSATINGDVYSNAPDGAQKSIQGYNSSQINGGAWAVGTISSPDPTVNCSTPPCKHPNASPRPMPIDDVLAFYDKWKTAAEVGPEYPSCSWSNHQTATIGPGVCPGNFSVSNGAEVTIQGPIYVHDNISVSNSDSKVKLDESFGSNGTVFITDGTVSVVNDGQFVPTSTNPKGYILIVSTSTNNSAISVSNQGVNAIFYALNGGAQLSNQAHVTALVAKKLIMNNSSILDYDDGLAGAEFSGGPGGSWQIKKGTYRFTSSP